MQRRSIYALPENNEALFIFILICFKIVYFWLVFCNMHFVLSNDRCIPMKLLFRFILLMVSCFVFSTTNAQGNHPAMEEVINAMKTNRGQGISRYFDAFVPIAINNTQSNYSHNQAEQVLKDFFDKNPQKDFTVITNGSTDNRSRYAIATFTTPNGKYSMYLLMRQKDNSFVVKEIRLTKE